ncbi:hypothetical protein Plhal703r1_c30g0118411 [Plasmopara halstedii]
MIVRPPQGCILPLMWTLVLLSTAETATPEAVVDVAAQHMWTHKPSKAAGDREFVEERVLPAVIQTVEHLPSADKTIPENVIGKLHLDKYLKSEIQKYDGLFMDKAIDKLIENAEDVERLFHFEDMLVWFGNKSPEDQKVAIDCLVQRLKKHPLTKLRLPTIFADKKQNDYLDYHFADVVEMKWWVSLSTNEMYKCLDLKYNRNHELFVIQVGNSIWKKINGLGEEEFSTFMLTKMRERSKDEIMWARIINDIRIDGHPNFPLHRIFDGLVRTNDQGAGNRRPFEAVELLTSVQFSRMFASAIHPEKVSDMVWEKLHYWSKDELMWANLVYILKFHEEKPAVFDAVIRPQNKELYDPNLYSPSKAIQDLTGPEFLELYENFKLPAESAELLVWLSGKSNDKLMWAKLLFMLRNHDEVSKFARDLLESILRSWTKESYSAKSNQLYRMKEVLTNFRFTDLRLYAYFSSDNPDAFILKRLLMLWPNEEKWACALNNLQNNDVQNPFSGVLGALLHSWIATPQHAAAENDRILIDAFGFLLEKLLAIRPRSAIRDTAQKMVHELLLKS